MTKLCEEQIRNFSSRLKALGISQLTFSQMVGIQSPSLSRIFSCKYNTGYKTIDKIEKKLQELENKH